MKRTLWLTVLMAVFSSSFVARALNVPQNPVVNIQKATIIAFYQCTASSDDENEALSDFQYHSGQIKQPLSDSRIDFKELYYSRSFRIRQGGKVIEVHPKIGVGYYLIAPGKKPLVENGVMTDTDLLEVARRYFGNAGKNL